MEASFDSFHHAFSGSCSIDKELKSFSLVPQVSVLGPLLFSLYMLPLEVIICREYIPFDLQYTFVDHTPLHKGVD